jgi:hypothetical protein
VLVSELVVLRVVDLGGHVNRYRTHPWLASAQAIGQPHLPNRIAWIETLLDALDDSPVQEPMHLALVLDSIARTFGLLSPAETPTLPSWLPEAIRQRFPWFARELDRDWTNADDDFHLVVTTVLRGASYSPKVTRPAVT